MHKITTPEKLPHPEDSYLSHERQVFDEPYKLGEVTGAKELEARELNIEEGLSPGGVYELDVTDPQLDKLSDTELNELRQTEEAFDKWAKSRHDQGLWSRKAGTVYTDKNGDVKNKEQWGDPVSHEEFFTRLDSPAINEWLKLIPSAQALMHLSDPGKSQYMTDRHGRPVATMDDTARLWMRGCTDAVGIRSRGAVMAELVGRYASSGDGNDGNNEKLKWMSVACGTALPAMKAAQKNKIEPDLTLVDFDPLALESTRRLAEDIGFSGSLLQHQTNIFKSEDMVELRSFLGDNGERPRVVDLMGIFEYTGENIGIDPAQFLRSNYDMLHPGGKLILGQMRSDRPVPDFTMGVVGWPTVEMRSPNELMKVIKDAGIDTKDVQLFLPDDGVYMVASIDKPNSKKESFAVTS